MRKALWMALLTAASVVPAVASAQDRGDWRERRGGNGGSQQSRPQAPQNGGGWRGHGGAERQQQPQAQPQQQAAPQAQQQRQEWRGNGGGWAGRRGAEGVAQGQPDANAGRSFGGRGQSGNEGWRGGAGADVQARAQADAAARAQADAQVRANRYGGNRDQGRGYRQPNAGFGQSGGDRAQGYRQQPRGTVSPDQIYRGGYRQGDQRYGRPGYAGNGGYRGDDRGRGGWNREWRGTGRYDWQHYRNENRSVFRLPRYYAPYGWGYGYRRFSIGFTLSPILFAQSYWIDDPYEYRLPDAYGEYRWVRYYNDALLVDVYSGEVVDVVYDIFY